MYIDIHCHLTGGEFESVGGVDGVIQNAKKDGVEIIVCSGYDLASSYEAERIANAHDGVYFTAGFHPSELDKYREGDLERLAALANSKKCLAIGEIGLDYHFEDNPAPETQRAMFLAQMQIAKDKGLPFVIHSRDAAEETYELLKANAPLLENGALLHCYSYSPEMAERFASLGLYFSFGGPVTFKNSKKAQESVRRIPATRLLSETDCPYLTPTPFRGEFPNQPKNVVYAVRTMAALKETTEEQMQAQIQENAKRLFKKL
ncbi:MAG: TatD family hydrolase [Clostridia bacterium]|nr:TatD family hydrolase [Clostridia bacterium]